MEIKWKTLIDKIEWEQFNDGFQSKCGRFNVDITYLYDSCTHSFTSRSVFCINEFYIDNIEWNDVCAFNKKHGAIWFSKCGRFAHGYEYSASTKNQQCGNYKFTLNILTGEKKGGVNKIIK